MKKLFFPILFVCAALMGCEGCNSEEPQEPDSTHVEAPVLEQVNIYLDNTVSMKGYADADNASSYTGVINAITTHYNSKKINGYYTRTKDSTDSKTKKKITQTEITEVEVNEMTSQLVNKNMTYTDSYQLDDFFKDVEKKTIGGESMSFFITDGIPSGTNEEIRNNPEFNISNASTLQSRISNALRSLGRTGNYGAAIYKFEAPFKGTYCTYQNVHKQLKNEERPFYVIAIGPKGEILSFDSIVEKGLNNFEKTSSVSFVPGNSTINLRPADSKYTAMPSKNNTTYIVMEESKTVKFILKKKELPSFVSTENLEIEWKNEIIGSDEIEYEEGQGIFRFNLSLYNHDESGSKLKIRVKNEPPQWVHSTNSADDRKIGDSDAPNELGKTFNLKVLVEGIREGILDGNGAKYQEYKVRIKTADDSEIFEDE